MPFWWHFKWFLRRWMFTVLMGLGVAALVLGGLRELENLPMVMIGPTWAVLLFIGGSLALAAKRAHVRSERTEVAQDVLQRLNNDEYCVLLRPFDHDGKTILPRSRWSGVMARVQTLEQTMAKAVAETFGIPTYAIVDQRIEFAPPGPVYMRASNDEWQGVALKMIGGAKVVMVMLPGGQDDAKIRNGFDWELEQIAAWGLQTRVLIVLPPDTRRQKLVREQAFKVLATLDGQPYPLVADRYRKEIPPSTLLIKVWQGDDLLRPLNRQPLCSHVKTGRVSALTYSKGLADLAGLSPWP